jgi:hypothetical protein
MIEPGELHRYFKVRETATGQELHLMNHDARYLATGPGLGEYRMAAEGEFFLVRSPVPAHPWGYLVRLEDVEPLPDGEGRYHPDHLSLLAPQMERSYEGSWRQQADLRTV